MWQKLTLGVAVLAACAGIAKAGDKEDLKAGLQKLADAPNYTWKTTVTATMGGGETTGMTEKDGFTTVSVKMMNNTGEGVSKGDKTVVKTADGWKLTSEMTGGGGGGGGGAGGGRMMAMMVQNSKSPTSMGEMIDKLDNIKKVDDGYTADLNEEAAKQMATMRRRAGGGAGGNGGGPNITNAKATLRVWCKDGMPTKTEMHITASVTVNGNDINIDRTSTTEISDVGSTKVTVPDEAKAKLTGAEKN